jgi:hypothetical protein
MDTAALFLSSEYVRFQESGSQRWANYLQVATAVAGTGKPDCASYDPDGQVHPCLPRFSVKAGSRVNAWHLGGEIQFTTAAITRLGLDEFALLAGHEIAHYYLGHHGHSADQELEADALGAILACRDGFRPDLASSLYRYARRTRTHPETNLRRRIVMDISPLSNCMPASLQVPAVLALKSE